MDHQPKTDNQYYYARIAPFGVGLWDAGERTTEFGQSVVQAGLGKQALTTNPEIGGQPKNRVGAQVPYHQFRQGP